MRIGRNEIVEELTEHMRQFGGNDWCVGTAASGAQLRNQDSNARRCTIPDSRFRIQDSTGNPDSRFKIQDSRENPDAKENPNMPGLAYREAHTPYAAAEAVEYLASAFGLEPARESRPGHIVFVYRLTAAGASSPHHTASDRHRQAAA